jgi:hypothetical protein
MPADLWEIREMEPASTSLLGRVLLPLTYLNSSRIIPKSNDNFGSLILLGSTSSELL